ncbi:hypothetical protein OC846_004852 [Tilletia horrida]|uniref:Uncharacterized protein n=1 Tax=Tilletia horrida TaxID=155126 RepID=A0AAN6JSC9_9BASI|nr:hypothetical protein OC845_005588 [Tilletia horrida]KAK0547434.1 hypothetical protein OC846_004852 [Tilletia horrida]KAK0561898.1 hypothetical protein OC861_005594 [Tilletia horrida]
MEATQAAGRVAVDATEYMRRARLKEAALPPGTDDAVQRPARSHAQHLTLPSPPTTPGEDAQQGGHSGEQPAHKKRKITARRRTRPVLIEPIHSPPAPIAPVQPAATQELTKSATSKPNQNASDLLRNMLSRHITESQLHLSEAYEEVRFDLAVRTIRSRELKEARNVLDERIDELQERIQARQSFYHSNGLFLPKINTDSGLVASSSPTPAQPIEGKLTNDRIAQVSFDREKAGVQKSDLPSSGFDLSSRFRAIASASSRAQHSNTGDQVILLEVLHRYLYPVTLSRGFSIKQPPKSRIQKPPQPSSNRKRRKKSIQGPADGEQSHSQGTLSSTQTLDSAEVPHTPNTGNGPSLISNSSEKPIDVTTSNSEQWPNFFESLDTIFAAAAAAPAFPAAPCASGFKSLSFDLELPEAATHLAACGSVSKESSGSSQIDTTVHDSLSDSRAPTVTDSVFGDEDKAVDGSETPHASLFDLAQAFGLEHQDEDPGLAHTQSEDQRTVVDEEHGESTLQRSTHQPPTNLQTDLDFDDLMAQLV